MHLSVQYCRTAPTLKKSLTYHNEFLTLSYWKCYGLTSKRKITSRRWGTANTHNSTDKCQMATTVHWSTAVVWFDERQTLLTWSLCSNACFNRKHKLLNDVTSEEVEKNHSITRSFGVDKHICWNQSSFVHTANPQSAADQMDSSWKCRSTRTSQSNKS
jgi:hypothetical protein